jgi:hypothetical protein
MEHAHTEVYRGFRIVIDYDGNPMNPRTENDNFGKMIFFHKRYNMGDDHKYASPQELVLALTGLDEEALGANPNDDLGDGSKYRIVWEPVYMYDHSGQTISTTPFSDPWDSGQLGIIYATYDDIIKNYGIEPLDPKTWEPLPETVEQAEKLLKSEVEEYDHYIRGDVFGYMIYATTDEDTDDATEDEDGNLWCAESEESVWGFFGLEYAKQQAREAVDAIVEQG